MSTEPPSNAEQQWGAQQPAQPWGAEQPAPRPRWSGRKTAAAVAIAVVIAAGGGAAIYAATSNDAGNTPGGRGGFGGPGFGGYGGPGFGPGGDGRMRGGLGAAALADALHGEFVMSDGSTELLQTGKVTSVSATSIAVSSTDGYAKTYVINGSTSIDGGRTATDAIKTGDQVTVIAKQSDNSALSILDQSALPQDGRQGQQPPGGQQPQPR